MSSGRKGSRCEGHGHDTPGLSRSNGIRPKSGRGSRRTKAHRDKPTQVMDDVVDENGTLGDSGHDNPSIFDELSADICSVHRKKLNGDNLSVGSSDSQEASSRDDVDSTNNDTLSLSDYVHILNDASDRLDGENMEDMNEIGGLFGDIYNVLDSRKSQTMELCRKLERMKTAMADVKGKLISRIEDKNTDPSLAKALNDLAKATRIASETESLACEVMMETEKVAEEANDVPEVMEAEQKAEEANDVSEVMKTDQKTEEANEVQDLDHEKYSPEDSTSQGTGAGDESQAAMAESDVAKVDDDVTTADTDIATLNSVSTSEDKTVHGNENEIISKDNEISEQPTVVEDNKEPIEHAQDDNEKIEEENDGFKEETPTKSEVVERDETPPPSPRPKSPIMNNKDRPLEWPHFTMNLLGDEDLSCFVRCRDGELASSSLRCSLGNISGDAIEDSEEVISNCITLSRPGGGVDDYELLSYPIVIAIPYQINARVANTKELVVKQRVVREEEISEENPEIVKTVEWKILQPLATDSSIADHKGQFVEVAVTRLTSFAVIARMVKDRMTISKKGGVIKSTAEHRVAVTYPQGACTLINVSLQIQPAESVANDLKTRFRHCSDLIGASPILHMTHTPSKKFDKLVTISVPCPPNPNKGNAPGSKGPKSEKKEIPPMLPEGAIVIRKTKKSSYGGDAADDFLHALYKQTEHGAWNDLDKVKIKQVRKDVVSLDLKRPVESLLVLRMGVETKYTPKQIATTFEQALQVKYANIILYHKVDKPEKIIVQIVQSRQLDSALRRLNNDDYEGPPDPSQDIPMTEGQEITIRLTGNVKIVGHDKLKLTFHTQRTNVIEFTIKEDNKFGNYSLPEYRGVAEFYGHSRVAIEVPDDPEEILLRESEAKAAEKHSKSSDFGGGKSQKEQKTKEKLDNVSRSRSDLLCKLAVTIPKSEPDPLIPPSPLRKIALDCDGVASNDNLRWLSKELGSEWEKMAEPLKIKRNRMQSIKRNNPLKMEEQIFDMLTTWRSMMLKASDKEKELNKALKYCKRYDLAEELKERKADVENDGSKDEE